LQLNANLVFIGLYLNLSFRHICPRETIINTEFVTRERTGNTLPTFAAAWF